jgi:hypothetical protein
MVNKIVDSWELSLSISDLYDLELNQLEHLDSIGRVARNIKMKRMYPKNNLGDKCAANMCRFGDWLNDDPGPGARTIVILVIIALAIGFFSNA